MESLGGESLIHGHIGRGQVSDTPIGETGTDPTVILRASADCEATRGDVLDIAVSLSRLHLFDAENEESLMPRIPMENRLPCIVKDDVLSFSDQRFTLPPALSGRASGKPCELILPTDAILLGTGQGRARIAEVECFDADGTRLPSEADAPFKVLYRLYVGGTVFFASGSGRARFQAGDTLPFDLDFSRITVEGADILPLPSDNRLDGHFIKEKEVDNTPHSPTCGRRIWRFYLDLADHPLTADPSLADSLFASCGTKIFRSDLIYSFPASALTLTLRAPDDPPSRDALSGRVAEILDYGRTTYASVSLGSRRIIAPYEGKVGDLVHVTLDQSHITVTDKATGMIIR